jgi:hypothetical protein
MNSLGIFSEIRQLPPTKTGVWVRNQFSNVGTGLFSILLLQELFKTKLFEHGIPKLIGNDDGGDGDDPFSQHFLFKFFLKRFFGINIQDFSMLSLSYQTFLLNTFKKFLFSIQLLSGLGSVAFSFCVSKFIVEFIFTLIEITNEFHRLEALERQYPGIILAFEKVAALDKNKHTEEGKKIYNAFCESLQKLFPYKIRREEYEYLKAKLDRGYYFM